MIDKKFLLLVFACLVTFQSLLKAQEEQLSLNGTWQFKLAKTEQAVDSIAAFYLPDFSRKDFKPIPVPSNWAILGFEEPVYRWWVDGKASEGFYLREFITPKNWNTKRVLLHFDGVWSAADVWLNGTYLGSHQSGFTPFAFDVTGKFKAGETNRLAVRVKQVSREYKFDSHDDWALGGIYRDVTLEAMPKERWLDRVVVQTSFDDAFKDADLSIHTVISDRNKPSLPGNYPSPGEPYDLRFTLSDKEGKEVMRREITVPAHISTDREFPLTLRVQTPKHWTAETPYLYNLRIDLLEKGKVTHTRQERVGFRQVSTAGGVFRINGQAVKLRGINRHDEHPDVGRATTREHWLQDLIMMKAANINYIRLSHYQPAKGFIELCDSMGMYLGDEVSIGGANDHLYDPSFSGAVLQRSYETVSRDINYPSVIYWSVGNEDPMATIHIDAVKLVKGLDPTRPVLLPWHAEKWLPKEIDILAPHYWKPQEYEQLAGNSDRPIISTEYTHAYGLDGMGSLEACWKALTKYPAGAGAAVWLWADQGLKTPVAPVKVRDLANGDSLLRLTGDGWDGIVDAYRKPTRDYWEVKAVYAQAYPTIDKITFVQGQASVDIPIQNDFDFTDLNTIKISWIIKEDEREIASGKGSVNGIPHAVAVFKLPLEKLKTILPGKTYYAWFTFTNTDGIEITRKAVELQPVPMPVAPSSENGKLLLTKGTVITIDADNIRYAFDSKTGQLVSAGKSGKTLITGLSPVIWRKIDRSEMTIAGGKEVSEATNLNHYTPTVESWKVEELEAGIIIHSKVAYVVNAKNRFTITYRYSIAKDGRLDVHYEMLTQVAVPWLPIVGMAVQSVPELKNIKWLGLGPYDAYPNKQAASILGVWGGKAGSEDVTGNKETRWIERSGTTDKFRIMSTGYLEHDAATPETIHILSSVLGRPEKGRKADNSVPQLLTNTGEPFVGAFSISLVD